MPSSAPRPVRRLLAAAALGVAIAGGVVLTPAFCDPGQASAKSRTSYASVSIDTSPLGASLYQPTGERLRAMMQAEMAKKFTITGDPTKPRLVVRITDIVVPANFGLDNQSGPAPLQTTDRMDGETLVVAPDGKVLRRFPVTVTAPSAVAHAETGRPGESGVEPDFRRLADLVKSFASWSARYAANP